MNETAYLAIDLTETSAEEALELAREAFPYHEIKLDVIEEEDYALDSFGLEWCVEYGSDYALLVDYDHADIITLCGHCSYWLEYGEEPCDDFTPSSELEELAEAGLSTLAYTEGGICAGCELFHEIAYSGGGWLYYRWS